MKYMPDQRIREGEWLIPLLLFLSYSSLILWPDKALVFGCLQNAKRRFEI